MHNSITNNKRTIMDNALFKFRRQHPRLAKLALIILAISLGLFTFFHGALLGGIERIVRFGHFRKTMYGG
jgi:hypothetical protein